MTIRKMMLSGISSALLLMGAVSVQAQVLIGDNSKGGFNGYQRVDSGEDFATAVESAKSLTFPGWTLNGVEILAPDASKKGHLISINSSKENAAALGTGGGGWIGFTDDETIDADAIEGENSSGNPYPALKAGSTELREVAVEGERGYGYVWVDGSVADYQNWNAGEPNDAGGNEDAAEMIGGGLWNDLPATGAGRASIVEFDLNLAKNPLDVTATLAYKGGKLEGQAFAKNSKGVLVPGTNYGVYQVQDYVWGAAVPANEKGGLTIEVRNSNINSADGWNAIPLATGGDFVAGTINTGTNLIAPAFKGNPNWINGGVGADAYPKSLVYTGSGFDSGNRENYGARATGEIYLKKGDYRFRDGNDDYTQLVVGGETLIDDTEWTSLDGERENGDIGPSSGGVAPGDEVVFSASKDGWYSINFTFAEGGGGDNWRLFWDRADSQDDTGATVASGAAADADVGEFFQVPTGVLRTRGTTQANIKGVERLVSQPQVGFGVPVPGLNGTDLGTAGAAVIPNQDVVSLPVGKGINLRLKAEIGGVTKNADITVDISTTSGGCPNQAKGDLDCNGAVNLRDFSTLRANFGKPLGAAVPEPSSLVLLGLGGLAGVLTLARRRR